jgi:hypothetical protein
MYREKQLEDLSRIMIDHLSHSAPGDVEAIW